MRCYVPLIAGQSLRLCRHLRHGLNQHTIGKVKSWTLRVIALVLIAMQAPSPPRIAGSMDGAAALDDGLVAYYSFDDGTATDNSGNGNDGLLFGTKPISGVLGNALHFNGSSDYVQVPHSSSLNLNLEFTISGWVKPVVPYRDFIPILTKGNTPDLSTPYAVVYSWTPTSIVPHARFTPPREADRIVDDLPISNSLSLNTWNCFVWRYSRGNLEIFRDGSKLGEQDLGFEALAAKTWPLEIGRDIPGATEFLSGTLDEIRIYDDALSDEDVQGLCRPFTTYLPLIIRNHMTFPLYIGDAIPVRPVVHQGEVFYTTSVRIPDELPSGGRFYFSSQRNTVAKALVDDELVVLLGVDRMFSYDFSTSGRPVPAIIEVPRATMEQLAGQTVTIEYRDLYAVVVEASTMWLIWTP